MRWNLIYGRTGTDRPDNIPGFTWASIIVFDGFPVEVEQDASCLGRSARGLPIPVELFQDLLELCFESNDVVDEI